MLDSMYEDEDQSIPRYQKPELKIEHGRQQTLAGIEWAKSDHRTKDQATLRG